MPSLLYSAAEEGEKKKKNKLALNVVITLQLCNSDICPQSGAHSSLPPNHLHFRTAGYHILTQITKRKEKKFAYILFNLHLLHMNGVTRVAQ